MFLGFGGNRDVVRVCTSVENSLVVSWLGTGVACCQSDKVHISYGWVERQKPIGSWMETTCNHISISYSCVLELKCMVRFIVIVFMDLYAFVMNILNSHYKYVYLSNDRTT